MKTTLAHDRRTRLGRRLAIGGALLVAGLGLPAWFGAAGCIGGAMIGSNGEITPLSPLDILGNLTGANAGCEDEGEPSDPVLKQMFDNLNDYRAQNGLPALRYSLTLEAAANAHAQDMYERGFFEHVNPDGDGPYERIRAQGYCLANVGENIGMTGDPDPMTVQIGWQHSPGHDANMRSEMWGWVGMGHYQAPADATSIAPFGGMHYWVQDFAGSGLGS